ncbi:hypothetical protein LguiB_025926 [Lonicera macranthoides]
MALSHLLQPKQTFHFRRIGFAKPRRWCSSSEGESEKSPQSKKGGAAREQKAKAVESYVNNGFLLGQGKRENGLLDR